MVKIVAGIDISKASLDRADLYFDLLPALPGSCLR